MNIFRHAHLPNHYEMQYTVFKIVIFPRNPLSCSTTLILMELILRNILLLIVHKEFTKTV